MSMPKPVPPQHVPPKFQVGDRVEFLFGVRRVHGEIVEDRGQIGVGGRRLYGIRFELTANEEPEYIEIPEKDIELESVSH